MRKPATTHTTATVATALRDLADVLDAMSPQPKAVRKTRQPKAAPKVAAKVAPSAPATKGTQSRETLSRSAWNRTLCTKARLAGSRPGKADESVYSAIQRDWSLIQAKREAGITPDAVLALYV